MAIVDKERANVVNELLVRPDQAQARCAGGSFPFGNDREHGNREDERPNRGDQEDDPDVQGGVIRNAEPVVVSQSKPDKRNEENNDAPDVAHSPSEATYATYVFGR